MNAATWGFIGTIVGAVVGTAGTLFATWLQQAHASRREREASERDAAERRRAFQRDTLMELQEALAALVRYYGRAQHLDEMEWRKTGTWGRSLLPEDVDSGTQNTTVRMILLSERIDDDDVRQHIRAFNDGLARLAISTDRDEAQDIMAGAVADYAAIQGEVGAVFRAL